MEKTGVPLAEIQDLPKQSLVLVAGPPGAGKSTFCHQVVLNGLAMDRPIIFVSTEHGPGEVIALLRERGMGELAPGALSFIDAFGATVGLASPERADSVSANCEDLNSISTAIAKAQERIGKGGILLAFDSLTSPYLFNKEELFRFVRLCLAKFAAEGNSVLALVDEGCGKEEDLVAMMSVADGVVKMRMEEDKQLLNIVKHPKVRPTKIEVPTEPTPSGIKLAFESKIVDLSMGRQCYDAVMRGDERWVRKDVGDFVNLFWPNLVAWSGMLWDPKRFPMMKYVLDKSDGTMAGDIIQFFPLGARLMFKLMPKNFSRVSNMKKLFSVHGPWYEAERSGIIEYLSDISNTDEHYFRVYESYACWGSEGLGAAMGLFYGAACRAGECMALERLGGLERDWNTVETKCIALGDPYCEFKLVPGEIAERSASLGKDSVFAGRIHDRLMDRLMDFLLHGKPLVERPKLGSDIHLHAAIHAMGFPQLADERYITALRMGGAKVGKEVGAHLLDAGISEDEAVKRVVALLEHCKVGKVTKGETIRIDGNCESVLSRMVTIKFAKPSCYFTTGFLNGFFLAVKNRHVRESRCIAMGDPYCEWEIK